MEPIPLEHIPDDRGFDKKVSMGYWNRVQRCSPMQGTSVFNVGKFEQVWCQGGKWM
jgi:hypothetical protein